MTKVCLLATTPALYTTLAAEISNWVFQRANEGWQVRVLKTTAASGYDLRAELAAQAPFDHLLIVGNLPMIYFKFNLDGHAERWLPAPYFLVNRDTEIAANRIPGTDNCAIPAAFQPAYAAVGWLSFDGLYGDAPGNKPGLTDAEIIVQYRKWFVRRESNDFQNYALRSILIDHFMGAGGYGISCEQEWAKFPGALHHWNPLAVNDDDGQAILQQDAMTYGVFTGGIDPGWLFYWSNFQKVRDYPVQSPIVHTWGSYECDVMTANLQGQMIPSPISMLRWLLVDKPLPTSKPARAICSVYNYAGQFRWSTFLNGGTIGEAGLASVARYALPICSVHGDPTIRLDSMSLQNLDLDNRVAALEAFKVKATEEIAALQTTGPAGTGGNPDGGGGPAGGGGTPPVTTGRINIGGPTISDPAGDWVGTNGTNGNPLKQQFQDIDMSACPEVPLACLLTGSYSGVPMTFTIKGVKPGAATLHLYFAETFTSGRKQRIKVNGVTVLDNFVISVAAGGMKKAVRKDFAVTVPASGDVTFSVEVTNGDPNGWISAASAG